MNLMEHKSGLWFKSPLQLPTSLSSWLFAAALFMNPLNGVRLGDAMSYGDLLFVLAGVVGLCERMLNRERVYFFTIYLIAAVLMTLSYLANNFSPEAMDAFDYLQFVNTALDNQAMVEFSQTPNFRIIFASVIIFPQVFLLLRPRSMGEVRALLYFWTAGAVYGAGFTVLYCNGFFSGHEDRYWALFHRARGLTGQPNAMAINSALALPGLLLLMVEAKRILPRVLAFALMLVVWQSINYSGSRTAIYTSLAMAIAIFILMYRDVPPQMRFRLIGMAVLVVAGYVLWRYGIGSDEKGSAFGRLASGSVVSDTVRATNREIATTGFMNSPVFGQGYQWLRVAHNMYLQILHSSGLVGFAGYMLALCFPFYMAWRADITLQDYSGRLLRNILLTAAFGVLVWGWAQPNINALNPTVPFGLLLYISVMRLGIVKQNIQRPMPLHPSSAGS